VYAPSTPEEVLDAATDLASARFIAYGTWKWTVLQARTGGKPVYRYLYSSPAEIPAGSRERRRSASAPWRGAFG